MLHKRRTGVETSGDSSVVILKKETERTENNCRFPLVVYIHVFVIFFQL